MDEHIEHFVHRAACRGLDARNEESEHVCGVHCECLPVRISIKNMLDQGTMNGMKIVGMTFSEK
jgi:hypothetical protein